MEEGIPNLPPKWGGWDFFFGPSSLSGDDHRANCFYSSISSSGTIQITTHLRRLQIHLAAFCSCKNGGVQSTTVTVTGIPSSGSRRTAIVRDAWTGAGNGYATIAVLVFLKVLLQELTLLSLRASSKALHSDASTSIYHTPQQIPSQRIAVVS